MKSALQSLLLAIVLSATSSAWADGDAPSAGDIKRAADSFDRGRDAFRAEEYVEAAEHFEAADGRAPSALALRFAIASRQEAGQLARAATLATLALARHPDDAELTDLARSVIEEAERSLHQVRVTCDEPCELVLDNKIVHGRRSEARTLFVEMGSHTLRASWSEDRSRSQRIEAEVGGSSEIDFYAPDIPTETSQGDWTIDSGSSTEDKVSKGGWSPVVFWSGLGVTVAGGVASTFLGLRALNEPGKETVQRVCQGQGTSCPEYQQGRRNQSQATIAIAATSAVGVFTIITGLFLTDWSGDDTARDSAHASPKKATAKPSLLGVRLQPWFDVGETTTIGATGTF